MKHNSANTLAIIITNYNKGPFIGKAIESVLMQTRKPDEIIVIDDASTDGSYRIVAEYASRFPSLVKAILLPENKGVQYARNKGLEVANSSYVCFLDGDDTYLTPDCIEKQMKLVRPNRLVGVYQLKIDQDDNIISSPLPKCIKKRYIHHPAYWLWRMENFMAWPWSYIVAKDKVIETNGFDNPYSLYEDSEMVIKLAVSGVRIVWLDLEGKGYRVGGGTYHLSQQEGANHAVAKKYIWRKYKKALPFRDRIYACRRRAHKVLRARMGSLKRRLLK